MVVTSLLDLSVRTRHIFSVDNGLFFSHESEGEEGGHQTNNSDDERHWEDPAPLVPAQSNCTNKASCAYDQREEHDTECDKGSQVDRSHSDRVD